MLVGDTFIIQFNSIHAFISDKSPYNTGYINYNHRLLIFNYNKAVHINYNRKLLNVIKILISIM